jgi:hypothetical protein
MEKEKAMRQEEEEESEREERGNNCRMSNQLVLMGWLDQLGHRFPI